jgi:hypothetical protein
MADSSRDSTTTLHEEPEGIALDGVFRSTSTIPGYNLVDPRVQSSSTTQATCLDINNPEKTNETLDESSLLQKLETIVSFPCRFLWSFCLFEVIGFHSGNSSRWKASILPDVSPLIWLKLQITFGFKEAFAYQFGDQNIDGRSLYRMRLSRDFSQISWKTLSYTPIPQWLQLILHYSPFPLFLSFSLWYRRRSKRASHIH